MRRPDKSFVVFKENLSNHLKNRGFRCILYPSNDTLCSLLSTIWFVTSLRVEKVKGYFLAEQLHIQINNDLSFYNKNLETTV